MKLFHEKFAQLSRKQPNKTALMDVQGALTYAQASAMSDKLAKMLVWRGLRAGEPVAVFVSRQKEVMVCALGILKAGGVYLPLDEQYPNERLFYMLDDAKARIVLADRDLVESRAVEFKNQDVVFVDEIEELNCSHFNTSHTKTPLNLMPVTSASSARASACSFQSASGFPQK